MKHPVATLTLRAVEGTAVVVTATQALDGSAWLHLSIPGSEIHVNIGFESTDAARRFGEKVRAVTR